MGSDFNGVSVVICCYNSAFRIEETLLHLHQQKFEKIINWEVILVDNASIDQTSKIAEEYWRTLGSLVPLRIIKEPRSGLSFARRAGIENSNYSFILFCDDDNHLDCNYIDIAFRMLETHPKIGILGGWCKPKFSSDPGKWIEGFYTVIAVEKDPKPSGFVDWVFGAGMVLRKSLLDTMFSRGIKLLLTDRIGSSQVSGGDIELCILARYLGFNVSYESSLILNHSVDSKRLSKRNFIKSYSYNFRVDMYLFIIERSVSGYNKKLPLFIRLFFGKILGSIYFIPRMVFGKFKLYSLVSFYSNIQFALWLIINCREFSECKKRILTNLNQGIG